MIEKGTLYGKNILLIGGGSGMGAASALALARNGAKVAIAGRRLENLESTALKSEDTNKILFKEKANRVFTCKKYPICIWDFFLFIRFKPD